MTYTCEQNVHVPQLEVKYIRYFKCFYESLNKKYSVILFNRPLNKTTSLPMYLQMTVNKKVVLVLKLNAL